MLTTSQARTAWAPPCTGPFSKLVLYGGGEVSVRPEVVEAVHALNACLEAAGYKTKAAETGAYNCRRITGGTGYSLHAYGIAIDINWGENPYGSHLVTDFPPTMVAAIKAIRTRNGKQVWRWGGDYSGNRDAMHFEVVCAPADIETAIDPNTVPGHAPADQEDEMNPEQWTYMQGMNVKLDTILATLEREGKLEDEELTRIKEIQDTQARDLAKQG